MAPIFGDTGNNYTSLTEVWDAYASVNGASIAVGAYGRFGGNGFRMTGVAFGTATLTKNLPSTYTTLYMGQAWKFNSLAGGSNGYPKMFFSESGTMHVYAQVNSAGQVGIYRGDGTLIAGPYGGISMTGSYYFEFKAVIDNSSGSVEFRVNDDVVISTGSLDTRNGGTGVINQAGIQIQDTSGTIDVSDIYISDSAYYGDSTYELLPVNGNGTTSDWDGSDGNQTDNYLLVDDTATDGDSTYVKTAAVGEYDLYTLTDLTRTTGGIKFVIYNTVARKDDAAARSIAPVVRIGGVNYDGTTISLGASYLHYKEYKTTSPATSAAWAISEVNGMQNGVKLVA